MRYGRHIFALASNSAIGILVDVTTTASGSISNGIPAGSSPSQKRVLLLKPRGFCAGVVRAIDIVKILWRAHLRAARDCP
jgi:4-hydroxy-3-methylbut-2-enyl diphosphate reductase